jgi:hypothetical protein
MVEHQLPKLRVAGSIPVFRSTSQQLTTTLAVRRGFLPAEALREGG